MNKNNLFQFCANFINLRKYGEKWLKENGQIEDKKKRQSGGNYKTLLFFFINKF